MSFKLRNRMPGADDEIIGSGGTAALLCENGRAVRTLIVTAGELLHVPDRQPVEVAELRRDDAIRAARVLGTPPPVFLGFKDGTLPESLTELSAALSVHIDEFQPDAIYAPWLLDAHTDHQALALALSPPRLKFGVTKCGLPFRQTDSSK